MSRPTTVGQLRAAGYADRTVKQELRANLLQRMGRGEELFDSIVGYGTSVLPGLERGILAGHDLILLGERGQAKTRLIRHLVELLDDEIPVIEGCEVTGGTGRFAGYGAYEPTQYVGSQAQLVSSAVAPGGQAVILAARLGRGTWVRTGLPALPSKLTSDPNASALMQRIWGLLSGH